jgi:hypothetical protein
MSRTKPRSSISVLTVGFRSRRATVTQDRQLREGRQPRLDGDGRARRIDPDRQVVQGHFLDVPGDLHGLVSHVGERLRVGDEQRLRAPALEGKPGTQRTGVMAEMERAGGAISGQDPVVGPRSREGPLGIERPRRRHRGHAASIGSGGRVR